ncbi:hypothetical protein Tco_0574282 [Tanacetum coccineum]
MPTRECTYQDFLKCQPLNFNGTEGVVGLTRWFEKMEPVFYISNCPEKYQVKYDSCMLLNSALTWWNSHKRTIGIEAAYTISLTELVKLMTEVYYPRNEVQKMETELCVGNKSSQELILPRSNGEVIENGNSWVPIPVTAIETGPSTGLKMTVPSTAEEKICKKNDVKARSLLLMALRNEHQLTFDQYVDAQSMFAAIKARFGGNEATKKTQKARFLLKIKEMRVLLPHLILPFPSIFRSTTRIPSNFDYRDPTLLKLFHFSIHDFNGFFDEMQLLVDPYFVEWNDKIFI